MARNNLAFQQQMWQQSSFPADVIEGASLPFTSVEQQGAIFTRPEVVDFMLDLVGYTPSYPLHQWRILEPSVGQGDFLFPIVDRLIAAWRANQSSARTLSTLQAAVRGVELHRDTFEATRETLIERLRAYAFSRADALTLADTWLIAGDFLLTDFDTSFDRVVGNPPYVRQERIPDDLMARYRARYHTIFDRADLYIPFIQRSLMLLNEGGQLGFICADRWMKNRYGGPLRQLVAEHFHLKIYVDMYDTPAFQSDVVAYPAITIIAREPGSTTRIAHRPAIARDSLASLATLLTTPTMPIATPEVRSLEGIATGAEPWILDSADQLALVRRLESLFPPLEEAGCKVGIGVATGADKAFITLYDDLDVEPDRKLPLVTTRDILTGTVKWRGFGVINPFADDGKLVNLTAYPRLQRYLEAHKSAITGRHIAQKSPASWYRTIDRIDPMLARKPKLLIPDIKGEAHIVYEPGQFYPHHNLYFITSDTWDLRALQLVLRSGIARLFVSVYSTRMRGGYLRFQAQYLRRICIPPWQHVPGWLKQDLIVAAENNDRQAGYRAISTLYGLTNEEQGTLDEGRE